MKTTSRIALGGIMGALSLLCLLLTVFPYATYALPALASLFLFPVIIEGGKRLGLAVYASTALLALLIVPDMEAKALYVTFFGLYPMLKSVAERIGRAGEWAIKLAAFNAAVVLTYGALTSLQLLPMADFAVGNLAMPTALAVLLLAGNVVFVVYDIGLTRVLSLYIYRFQPLLRRYWK